MIHVDESDPVGDNKLSFPPRDVTIKRGVDAKEFYDLLTEVGRGKFGTVYKCKEKLTGLQLAAKFVPIPKRDDRRNVEREVEIMNSLQHSLIIQLYDAYEYQKMMCVVLELIEGGELFDRVIDDDFILTEKACIIFIRQVCQAMEFIHRNNILHLDLKPENILCLTRDGNRVKVIDFGLARKYDPDKKLQILFGTPEFVAPEVVNFDRISFGTDMWSVGVICYVLLSGLSPFMGETDVATMANVTIAKYDFDDEVFTKVSKESLDFISKLLVKDISTRMTATECIEHSWLRCRSKPQVAPKPNDVPPPKYRTTTSPPPPPPLPPPPPSHDIQHNELEMTKENLKNFIERWEEHPNSPYVFEASTNLITPISKANNSTTSSRVCSPSPCGSLSSTSEIPDNILNNNNDNNINSNNNNNNINNNINNFNNKSKIEFPTKNEIFENNDGTPDNNFKEYLQTFERRHSDSNCLLNRSSSCEKINLAEEIKKLSERLLMLSSINTDLNDYNKKLGNGNMTNGDIDVNTTATTKKTKKSKLADNFKNRSVSVIEMSSNSNNNINNNNNNNNNNSNMSVTKKTVASTKKSTVVSALSERLKQLDETPSLKSKIKTDTNAITNNKISIDSSNKIVKTTCVNKKTQFSSKLSSTTTTSTTTTTNNSISNNNNDSGGSGSAPWPVTAKRTKFRITQLSRDVPIDSPDTHKPVFLDETADKTKDRLLHLLEKYNENDSSNHHSNTSSSNQLRHQSFSVDFDLSDNLEYRSMNSLNAFFQRHALIGTNVKQIQKKIESNNK